MKDKMWISVTDWYGKTKAVCLRKKEYMLQVANGKSQAVALRAAAKKLRELAAECTRLAKGDKDEDS